MPSLRFVLLQLQPRREIRNVINVLLLKGKIHVDAEQFNCDVSFRIARPVTCLIAVLLLEKYDGIIECAFIS